MLSMNGGSKPHAQSHLRSFFEIRDMLLEDLSKSEKDIIQHSF
jgi:hypothetical protein